MSATLMRLQASPGLVERVYVALRDAIADGSLAPGERLTQEDVAERLAVSRQPVLQALRLLKKDGLLLDAPGRGVLVAPLDAATIAEVYAVRGALDALAARLAAERRAVIDPALLERGRRAARGKDIRAMVEADLAFHRALYEASGNPRIASSAEPHWLHLRRVMGAVLRSARQRDGLWDEHAAIAAAIGAGQAARAGRLVEQHARQACANLIAQLSSLLAPAAAPATLRTSRPGAER